MKRVAYIGGRCPKPTKERWGGSIATNNAYLRAFADDSKWTIDLLPRDKIKTAADIEAFSAGADLVHLDDTNIAGMMFAAGMPTPDVIGPITRSPVKDYKGWTCPYSEAWFYRATVIRLNHAEERQCPERVQLVVHGIDTDRIRPIRKGGNVILWAGDDRRPAKNFELWEEIKFFPPPPGYRYATLTDYAVEDYWQALPWVAAVVNTSRYESFCCAAFEAMAAGVPVVWRKGLQGGPWEDAGIRVDYTARAYAEALQKVCPDHERLGQEARAYVETHCTLKHMRESYAGIFQAALEKKGGEGA